MSDYCKGQSAIEYLMTYGWMLIVVAIVGGAVFSLIENETVESSSGFDSDIFLERFGMNDFSMNLGFENYYRDQIEVTEIEVSNEDTDVGVMTFPGYGDYGGGKRFSVSLPLFRRTDTGSESIDVKIKYNISTLNISSSGTLTGGWELDNSAVGYWSLADESGDSAMDSSPNGYDSESIDGSVTQQASGFNGPAYEFSGDNSGQVNIGEGSDLASITGKEEITIGATVYMNGDPDTLDHDPRILERASGSTQSEAEYLLGVTRNADWRVAFNTPDNETRWEEISASDDHDKWTSVVATYDGEEAVLYTDGERRGSTSKFGGPIHDPDNPGDVDVTIGNTHQDFDPFIGKIQDVFVMNRVLNENEIEAYSEGKTYSIK